MNGSEEVCLDASVYLSAFFVEPESAAARRLIEHYGSAGRSIAGPAFLAAEVLSVLRGRVRRGMVTQAEADSLVTAFLALPIAFVSDRDSYQLAWRIASDLALPVIYDAIYLAVALAHDTPYWTADSAFYERAKDAYPSVRLLAGTGG